LRLEFGAVEPRGLRRGLLARIKTAAHLASSAASGNLRVTSGSCPVYSSRRPAPIIPTVLQRRRRFHLNRGAALALVLVSAIFGLGVDACLETEGQRKAELRRRAEEILPPGTRVRVLGYGDCVELAASPSCAQVVFEMAEHDSARRAALVREKARRSGWAVTHSDDAAGGWSVFLKRNEFTAVVFLWRPEVYDVDCEGQPDPNSETDKFCFNTLNVSR
jgi:hypothetical protein